MNATWIIARKEITDALKNKLFMIILGMLLILTVVSVVLGAYQVRVALDNYTNAIEFLKSLGKTELPPMPNLNPISASKGFVNYIGMLGALLAMILGNYAIVKERRSGTLKLILSRKVFLTRSTSAFHCAFLSQSHSSPESLPVVLLAFQYSLQSLLMRK